MLQLAVLCSLFYSCVAMPVAKPFERKIQSTPFEIFSDAVYAGVKADAKTKNFWVKSVIPALLRSYADEVVYNAARSTIVNMIYRHGLKKVSALERAQIEACPHGNTLQPHEKAALGPIRLLINKHKTYASRKFNELAEYARPFWMGVLNTRDYVPHDFDESISAEDLSAIKDAAHIVAQKQDQAKEWTIVTRAREAGRIISSFGVEACPPHFTTKEVLPHPALIPLWVSSTFKSHRESEWALPTAAGSPAT